LVRIGRGVGAFTKSGAIARMKVAAHSAGASLPDVEEQGPLTPTAGQQALFPL